MAGSLDLTKWHSLRVILCLALKQGTHAVGSLLSPAVLFIFSGMVTLLQEQTAALVLAAGVFGLLQSTFSGGSKPIAPGRIQYSLLSQ